MPSKGRNSSATPATSVQKLLDITKRKKFSMLPSDQFSREMTFERAMRSGDPVQPSGFPQRLVSCGVMEPTSELGSRQMAIRRPK